MSEPISRPLGVRAAAVAAALLTAAALSTPPSISSADVPSAPAKSGAIPGSLADAAALHASVASLNEKGLYKDARAAAERALAIREAKLGASSLETAESQNDLAEALTYLADLDGAEALFRRALATREAKSGGRSLETAESLDGLAVVCVSKRRLSEAEGLFARALEIREEKLGSGHKLVASTLGDIAAVYYYQGALTKAEAAFTKALAASEAALGKDDPGVAVVAGNLAALYDEMERDDLAKPLHERALAIRRKAFGHDHPLVALSLSNLAALAQRQGDVVRAVALAEEALAIRESLLGKDHPAVAATLNNLAAAYEARGDEQRALKLYERALGIFETKLGPDDPQCLQVTLNYARLLATTGELTRAVPYLDRLAKGAGRSSDALSIDVSISIAQLATQAGLADEAREIGERLLPIALANFGPTHTRVAQTLTVIGDAREAQRDHEGAIPMYRLALDVAKASYGPKHEQVARVSARLARSLAASGDASGATAAAAQAAEIDEAATRAVIGAGSEAQKRDFMAQTALHIDQIVDIHQRFLPNDGGAARLALEAILRRKGRVLDALTDGQSALRRRLSPDDASLLDELARARAAVASGILRPPRSADAVREQAAYAERAEAIEREISAKSAASRAALANITVETIQARVPEGSALVEVFLRRPRPSRAPTPPRYTAYVLRHTGPPAWVDLGEAPAIDDAVTALRRALSDPSRTDAGDLGRALDELAMRPIRRLLGGATRVLYSPDGALSLVPIAALKTEAGRYFIEDYSISYLTSGRDLLRMGGEAAPRSGAVVLANPNFGTKREARGDASAIDRSAPALSRAVFSPLPGTRDEALALRDLLSDATFLTDGAASESAMKRLRGPRLLHIATHGFFVGGGVGRASSARSLELDLGSSPNQAPLGAANNPLLASGLALAKANERPDDRDDDGVLTALEASSLDLVGTKLVVLSACETAVGSIEAGEGVIGLRRAFAIAGAESAVMSLWKVDDRATRDLMISMYTSLAKDEGRAESLRGAQLGLLRGAYAHPYYWAAFIPIGDYRTLSEREPAPRSPSAPLAPPRGPRGCSCEVAESAAPHDARRWIPAALLAIAALRRRRDHR